MSQEEIRMKVAQVVLKNEMAQLQVELTFAKHGRGETITSDARDALKSELCNDIVDLITEREVAVLEVIYKKHIDNAGGSNYRILTDIEDMIANIKSHK